MINVFVYVILVTLKWQCYLNFYFGNKELWDEFYKTMCSELRTLLRAVPSLYSAFHEFWRKFPRTCHWLSRHLRIDLNFGEKNCQNVIFGGTFALEISEIRLRLRCWMLKAIIIDIDTCVDVVIFLIPEIILIFCIIFHMSLYMI